MLLAIDTATRMLSLALHDGNAIRAEITWETANYHTVELAPAIDDLCRRAGIGIPQLTRIAIAQGPGSFSGLRAGMAVAKGLAMALRIPLIAVPTLDIVAAAQRSFAGELIVVAQIGRGRVCAGHYSWQQTAWAPIDDPQIIVWESLLATIASATLLAGEMDATARSLITQRQREGRPIVTAPPAFNVRRAGFLADLALVRADMPSDPASVVPLYVNQPGVSHP